MGMMRFRGLWSCRAWHWTCALPALPALLVLGGCMAGPGSDAPDTAPTVLHADLRPEDTIEGLDLATGPDGTVHLVWRERLDPYEGSGDERIMYRRGRGDPVRWDPPMLVAEDVPGPFQVIVRRDGVHVLAGLRLAHWWLPAGADRWQAQSALLNDDAPLASEFDAVTVGDSVVIAYTRSFMVGESAVYSLRWEDKAVGEPGLVARYPVRPGVDVHLSEPTLLPRPDRLLLLWGGHILVEERKPSYTQFRDEGGVYAIWSMDGGTHWTQPDVNTGAAVQTSLYDIAAVGVGPEPLALFAANGLFASRWHDGAWSLPRQLADYKVGDLSGSAKTFRVEAEQCAGQTLVAWVDGRYQRSDRRWWNPLGGFPWSDDPDWDNNDLFVLSGRELQAELRGDAVLPRRQTAPGSYTVDIALVDRDDHALLVWAGRAQVKKSRVDMGASPTIWQRRLECD